MQTTCCYTTNTMIPIHRDGDRVPFIDAGPYGYFNDKEVKATVRRGHTQFTIKATIDCISNAKLGRDLQKQVDLCRECPYGKYGSLQTPADLMFQCCLPLLKTLAPQTSHQDRSLESFLHAPTYHLKLIGGDADDAIVVAGQDDCSYTPAFFISPIAMTELPTSGKDLPQFRASEVQIAPTEDAHRSLTSVQGRVSTKDGRLLYFKPRLELRELEFERELRVLSQVIKAGVEPEKRVPRLEGIVVSGENDEIVMGMLMTMIHSPDMGCDLMSKGFWDKPELHQKWEKQVTATVHDLHANNIVWGDVNPMNVVIDEAFNAWVIDFGGMNNMDFVDDENRETVKGDWQGIERLFQQWLPRRVGKLK